MFSENPEQDDNSGDHGEGDDSDLESEDLDPLTKLTAECRDFFALEPTSSDKAWNQISLDPQLHKWWSEGFFAFNPLGIGIAPGCTNQIPTPTVDGPKDTTYTRLNLEFH